MTVIFRAFEFHPNEYYHLCMQTHMDREVLFNIKISIAIFRIYPALLLINFTIPSNLIHSRSIYRDNVFITFLMQFGSKGSIFSTYRIQYTVLYLFYIVNK